MASTFMAMKEKCSAWGVRPPERSSVDCSQPGTPAWVPLSSQYCGTLFPWRQAWHFAVCSWQHVGTGSGQPTTPRRAGLWQKASFEMPSLQARHSAVSSPQHSMLPCAGLLDVVLSQPMMRTFMGFSQNSLVVMPWVQAKHSAVAARQQPVANLWSLLVVGSAAAAAPSTASASSARARAAGGSAAALSHAADGISTMPKRREGNAEEGTQAEGAGVGAWRVDTRSSATKSSSLPCLLGTKRGQACER
mmetsp:Transcript_17331/g.52225  ORF Transcript_17331/g.52225 Transcript_17331/m.52225 type:complete len:248 (-) Transcript_17331:1130-1873(-)